MGHGDAMKRTHFSTGPYVPPYTYRPGPNRRVRAKHETKCGTLCDATKATTVPYRVTCRLCLKKLTP